MRVAIVGSRDYPNLEQVRQFVRALAQKYPRAEIVSGGARGVDQAAQDEGIQCGLVVTPIPAEWDKYKRSNGKNPAGMIRNQVIVDNADIVVAFWDGKSRGTKHTIDTARKDGKQVYVYGVQ